MRSRVLLVIVFVLSLVAPAAACGWDWTVEPKAGSDAGDAGDNDSGQAKPACLTNKDCGQKELCTFADNQCGRSEKGTCLLADCDPTPQLTCGCDGHVYQSMCEATDQGVDLAFAKSCPPPTPDVFPCGTVFCTQGSFCADGKVCIPWACEERSCECAGNEAQCPGAPCEISDGGATYVTCGKK